MESNYIKNKSFEFALKSVKLFQILITERKEFILSKQFVRSSTSVGAMVREAEFAESKADFIHKMAIAQKEINESLYWLELLHHTSYLKFDEFRIHHKAGIEIIKMLTSIIKKSKGLNK